MLFAQDSGGGPVIVDLLQYGVLGLVVVGLLLGWLWAKPAVEDLRRDKMRAETQRDELIRMYDEKIIPALAESAHAIDKNTYKLTEVGQTLNEVNAVLEKMRGGKK